MITRHGFLSAVAVALAASAMPLLAHHGWSWTSGGNIRLEGIIVEARLGNPHGVVIVEADGERWTVEVGQPWRNERAGLADGDFAAGTEMVFVGEPAADTERKVMKAEHIELDGTEHLLYPDRD